VRVSDLAVGEIAEYELVGVIEPNVGNGRVSIAAPVGRALVGQRSGAQVDVATPRGTLRFEILSVRPPNTAPLAAKAA
jgi:transcription elongation factor GreA